MIRSPVHAPRRPPSLRPLAACLLAALGVATAAPTNRPVHPATIVVENCNDDGPGSLREAYAVAVDGDVVDMSSLVCSTITLTSGPLLSAPTTGYVVLQGNRYNVPTIDGGHADRVIVHTGARVGLRNLIVTGGVTHDAAGGGCIYSSGDVDLQQAILDDCETSTSGSVAAKGGGLRALGVVFVSRSRVTHNHVHAAASDADGGGIYARTVISGSQSTISGNTASGDGSHYARGGGVFASYYLRFDEITLSDNEADSGGAAYLANFGTSPPSAMSNATISGNRANGAAGGILAGNSFRVYNSTVANNSAVFDFGAGIYLASGDLLLTSTIVANNSTGDGLHPSDIGGHAGAVITGSNDLVIASTLALPDGTLMTDPMLGPLADNGGDVETHALLRGSPAIDAGDNPRNFPDDERGFICLPNQTQCGQSERTVGAGTDIGAFELGGLDHLFEDGFDPVT